MIKLQNVLIHVDGAARATFFGTLVAGLPENSGLSCFFITESRAALLMLTKQGHDVRLLSTKNGAPDNQTKELYENSLCGALGNFNLRVAANYKSQVDEIVSEIAPDVIWCWNGTKFIDRCLRASDLPFKALEVANISGHFVVEDDGVNAESKTYRHLVTENAPVIPAADFAYATWQASYMAGKETQNTIPQAHVAEDEARDKLRHLLDLRHTTPRFVLFQIDRIVGYGLRHIIERKIRKVGSARKATGTVVFFPQQVSSDSQLIFNAEHDNLSALRLLLSELPADGVLVTNLHPAEHRLSRKLAFLRLCRKAPQLIPAAGGAWQYLKTADVVVTINSTVGLEATILGKSCRFLGKSPFTRLNKDPEALKWFLGTHIMPNSAALETPVTSELIRRLKPDAFT